MTAQDAEVKLLGKATIATRCEVSVRQVERWIESGELKAHKLGSLTRVTESDFVDFLATHLKATAA